jgi:hypothetical protein
VYEEIIYMGPDQEGSHRLDLVGDGGKQSTKTFISSSVNCTATSNWSPVMSLYGSSTLFLGTVRKFMGSHSQLGPPLAEEFPPNHLELLNTVGSVIGPVAIQISQSIEDLLFAVS